MSKLQLVQGTTSKLVHIFIQNSSVTTGAGLTGLTSGSSGLTCYYLIEGANATVSVSLSAGTLGTWSSGGFIVVDGTNMPGMYELGLPNLALASGKSVIFFLQGAANMVPTIIEIETTQVNNQSATAFMTSVGSVTGSVGSVTGAVGSVTGAVGSVTGAVGSVTGNVGGNVTGTVGSIAGFGLLRDTAFSNFTLYMVESTDHITPYTGLGSTVSGQVTLDGAALTNLTNTASISKIGSGFYSINLAAADVNGNNVGLVFSATGADPTIINLITQ